MYGLYTGRESSLFGWKDEENVRSFSSFFALSACGLTCTEHSRLCWNSLWLWLHDHSIPGMPSSLYSLDPELIAYWYQWCGVCVWRIERDRGWSVNHRAKSRDMTLTPHAQSANGAAVSSNLQSHSQMVCFRVNLFFEVFHTAGASLCDHRGLCWVNQTSFLPCDPPPLLPQKLTWCWVSLWDVVSKRLLRANQVRWHPLLRELWRRQLRKCVPSQVDLPGQRGGGEKTAQDWKRGRSHNCLGFSYTF